MKRTLAIIVAGIVGVALAAAIASAAPKSATVVTDASDYPPGTQVNVTGTGWLPSEVVQLTFTETSTTPPRTGWEDNGSCGGVMGFN